MWLWRKLPQGADPEGSRITSQGHWLLFKRDRNFFSRPLHEQQSKDLELPQGTKSLSREPQPQQQPQRDLLCSLTFILHLPAKFNSHGSSFWGWFSLLPRSKGRAAAPRARPRCTCPPQNPIYLPLLLQRHLQSPSPAAPRAQSCSPGHQAGLLLADIPWSLSLGKNLGEIQNPTLKIQPELSGGNKAF